MKCVICDLRRSKRFCPAKSGLICPQCCGEKRVVEIDCPESCVYLKAGRERQVEEYGKRLRGLKLENNGNIGRLLADHQDAVAQLEFVLARERLADRNLTDSDVITAANALLETYRTEDKGVLYEKTCDDLRIETLRRELRKTIESLRNPQGNAGKGVVDPGGKRLPLSAAMECLEYLISLAASFLADRDSASGYVDFLARLMPREEKRGSILMP